LVYPDAFAIAIVCTPCEMARSKPEQNRRGQLSGSDK